MASLEDAFNSACDAGQIRGAVLAATDRTGRFSYAQAFGVRSFSESSTESSTAPQRLKDVFRIASCTKLMTTIAALQCVERELIALDEDVGRILPELSKLKILTGFTDGSGEPILVEHTKIITLRQLLSHTSGLGNNHVNPLLVRYCKLKGMSTNVNRPGTVEENYLLPLVFEPGTSWAYGSGHDWAGVLVVRASASSSLEDYMARNIWGPLEITDITFHISQRADLLARQSMMSQRDTSVTKFRVAADPNAKLVWGESSKVWTPLSEEAEAGGSGAYATAVEYIKILKSIISDDGKLLTRSSIDEMFKPQLGPGAEKKFMLLMSFPDINRIFGGFGKPVKMNWGLCGALLMEDVEGRRTKGSLNWGGTPNLHWWMDRTTGLAGFFASQLMPPGDAASYELNRLFEMDMYRRIRDPTSSP